MRGAHALPAGGGSPPPFRLSLEPNPGCRTRLARPLVFHPGGEGCSPGSLGSISPSQAGAPQPHSWGHRQAEGLGGPEALPAPPHRQLPRESGGRRAVRTAALLVRVVPAVVVVVALPATRHAAVVLAAELVGLAGSFIWEGRGRDRRQHRSGTRGGVGAAALCQPPSDPALPMWFGKGAAKTSPGPGHSREAEGTGSARAA